MLTGKANTFCLYKILFDYSDADNILTRKQIEEKLLSEYGLEFDRRTLKSSLLTLEDMGFEISFYEDNKKGYYLMSRDFDPSEVRVLIDSVYFNSSIPKKQTEDLVKKLQLLLPMPKRKKYKNLTIASSTKKTINKEMFYNIDILDEAISNCKRVEFTYLHYNFKKQLVPKRKEKYLVSPYALIAAKEHYYLIGKYDNYDSFAHFRIDKIKDIEILPDKFKKTDDFDISRYADINTMMHRGECISAQFKCKNYVLDYLIDEFGQNARILENDDGETFTATVSGTFDGLRIWAMHYLDCTEVLEPQDLREEMLKIINENMYVEGIK